MFDRCGLQDVTFGGLIKGVGEDAYKLVEAEPGSEAKSQEVSHGKKPFIIFRAFGALKSYYDKQKTKKKPTETDHQRNERLVATSSQRIGNLTYVIAFAAIASVVVSGLQYCTLNGQQAVMQGQLAEMQAQEQPWIKFTAMATGIDFDPKTGDATFNYKFSMKNVGNSMARNIRLTYSETIVLPHSSIGMFTVFDLEKAGCAKQIANNATANEDAINGGEVLFPGETSLNDPNAYYWSQDTIPIAQIKSAAWPIMPEDFSAYWVGCVTYNTSYESTRHKTDFIYDVNGLDPSDPYKIPRLLKIGHSLNASELLLRDDYLSGGGMN